MKNLVWALALIALCALWAQPQQQSPNGKDLVWAYPVPDKNPPAGEDKGPKKLAGSSRSYTQAQIDDQFNPPDWFPEEHAALPRVVAKGSRELRLDQSSNPVNVRRIRPASVSRIATYT